MAGALERLRGVDLARHLSGPYCAMLLADHGADVIKVEKPGGDEARGMPPFMRGESAPFMVWNRNKRSVVIDLKSGQGKAQLLALIDGADVLIENFRPATLDRLGLGWPSLRLWPDRSLSGARRLRSHLAGHVGVGERVRTEGRAAASPADCDFRHRRWHALGRRHSGGAEGTPSHRPRSTGRNLAPGSGAVVCCP